MTTAGPSYAGTAADDATVGTISWANPTNATASDNSRADATLTTGTISHYLKATNFGFSIPAVATINGITVAWELLDQSAIVRAIDYAVRIVKGGTIGATDKGRGATAWPGSDAFVSFGGESDLWGETWTVDDINASTFGAAISAKTGDPGYSGHAYIDSVRITITYTLPAPTVTAISPTSGPSGGGTSVTVTGTGFLNNSPGTNTVTLKGAAASGVSVVSDTSITATSGAGTLGLGNVAVSNNNGTGTLVNGWTYLATLVPKMLQVTRQAVMRAATR